MTKKIFCSICGNKIGEFDTRSTTTKIYNCRDCRKQTVYNPLTDTIKLKDIPHRTTASGMTFI